MTFNNIGIDLDLQHYTKADMENLFGAPTGYKADDLKTLESSIRTKILDNNITDDTKQQIVTFLEAARNKLTDLIIPVPVIPFIQTQVNEVSVGSVNPIEKRIINKSICIDTLFRPQYTTTKSTDFTYSLPESIKNVISMKITGIELPNMWFSFSTSKKSNQFSLSYTPNGSIVTNNVVIPEGNYLSSDMVNTMNSGLTTPTDSLLSFISNDIVDNKISMSISDSTTKTTLTGEIPFSVDFELPNVDQFKTAGWALGFRKGTYSSTQITNTQHTITSESSYGSSFDNYFFIDVDDYHNNFVTDTMVSVITKNGVPAFLGKNIMARIPIDVGSNSIIMNTSSDGLLKSRNYFGPIRLERIRIRLLDRFGQVIDLNGNDFSMEIDIEELYA